MSNRYELGSEIGRGTFGKVLAAREKATGTQVAIKIVSAQSRVTVKLLRQEIAAMRANGAHPNLVALIECFEVNGDAALVMDYCSGGDLHKYMRASGPLSEAMAWHFVEQIVAGLRHMHLAQDVVHRDLKPANLLLADASDLPRLLIADFGLSRALPYNDYLMQEQCGTVAYAAPEVLRGSPYKTDCDMWSVGVILYEMLMGALPPSCTRGPQTPRVDVVLPPKAGKGIVSPRCREVVAKLLTVDENNRLSLPHFKRHPFMTEFARVSTVQIGTNVPAKFVVHTDATVHDLEQLCAVKFGVPPAHISLHKNVSTAPPLKSERTLDACGALMRSVVIHVGTTLIPPAPARKPEAALALPAPAVDYNKFKVIELKQQCQARGIVHPPKILKVDLVALLLQRDNGGGAANYNEFTVVELKQQCRARRIAHPSKIRKAQLVALLLKQDNGNGDDDDDEEDESGDDEEDESGDEDVEEDENDDDDDDDEEDESGDEDEEVETDSGNDDEDAKSVNSATEAELVAAGLTGPQARDLCEARAKKGTLSWAQVKKAVRSDTAVKTLKAKRFTLK